MTSPVFVRSVPYARHVTCSELHRHGRQVHDHAYRSPHRHLPPAIAKSVAVSHGHHDHDHQGQGQVRDYGHHDSAHGHSHGLLDPSVTRSREGIRAVAGSLAVLGAAAAAQTIVFVASGSVALLADLVHNGGDALTAVPLAIAFGLRSETAERRAGLAVVLAVFISAASRVPSPSIGLSTRAPRIIYRR